MKNTTTTSDTRNTDCTNNARNMHASSTPGDSVHKGMDEDERLILCLYDGELKKRQADPEYKKARDEEALYYARGYLGDEVPDGSPAQAFFNMYLMGLETGLKVTGGGLNPRLICLYLAGFLTTWTRYGRGKRIEY